LVKIVGLLFVLKNFLRTLFIFCFIIKYVIYSAGLSTIWFSPEHIHNPK
jgi:hypothetical protein